MTTVTLQAEPGTAGRSTVRARHVNAALLAGLILLAALIVVIGYIHIRP